MTNQEIYDDLGQLGSILYIAVLMAQMDGEVDKSEMESLVDTFAKFVKEEHLTSEVYGSFLSKIISHNKNSLKTFEAKLSYVTAVLDHFQEAFSEGTRREMLQEFSSMAMADGELHENEAALLNLIKARLG